MGRPDFDVPNDKSLAESKEYWEDQLESGEEMLASAETDDEKENAQQFIDIAKENLKDL